MSNGDRSRVWMGNGVELTAVHIEEEQKTLFVDFLHGGDDRQDTMRFRLSLEQASQLLHQLNNCLSSQGVANAPPAEQGPLQ